MPKFGKFSVSKSKYWPNPVQEASFGPKISSASSIVVNKSVQQPTNLAPICSTNPYFRPFRPHTPTKMKVEYPLQAPRYEAWMCIKAFNMLYKFTGGNCPSPHW